MKRLIVYAPLFLAIILCVVLTWIGQSFLAYNAYNNSDSSYFVYGGRIINEGFVLYKDFWDQKPPAIFIQNAILLKLFSNNFIFFAVAHGVVILLLCVTLFTSLKKVLNSDFLCSVMVIFFCYGFNLNNYQDFGNRTEFGVAIFEMLAFCFALRYFVTDLKKRIFLAGVCSAIATFYKPVGMASYFALTASVMIFKVCSFKNRKGAVKPSENLSAVPANIVNDCSSEPQLKSVIPANTGIQKKRGGLMKELFYLNFGFLGTIFIFSTYLYSKGILLDAFDATLITPLSLSQHSPYSLPEILQRMFSAYGPLWGCLFPIFLYPFLNFREIKSEEKKILLFSYLFCGASLCGIIVQKFGRPHYYLLACGPLLICSLMSFSFTIRNKSIKNKSIWVLGLLLCFLFFGKWSAKRQYIYFTHLKESSQAQQLEMENLVSFLHPFLNNKNKIFCWSEGYAIYNFTNTFSPALISPYLATHSPNAAKKVMIDFKKVTQQTQEIPLVVVDNKFSELYFDPEKIKNKKVRKKLFKQFKDWLTENYQKVEYKDKKYGVYILKKV